MELYFPRQPYNLRAGFLFTHIIYYLCLAWAYNSRGTLVAADFVQDADPHVNSISFAIHIVNLYLIIGEERLVVSIQTRSCMRKYHNVRKYH